MQDTSNLLVSGCMMPSDLGQPSSPLKLVHINSLEMWVSLWPQIEDFFVKQLAKWAEDQRKLMEYEDYNDPIVLHCAQAHIGLAAFQVDEDGPICFAIVILQQQHSGKAFKYWANYTLIHPSQTLLNYLVFPLYPHFSFSFWADCVAKKSIRKRVTFEPQFIYIAVDPKLHDEISKKRKSELCKYKRARARKRQRLNRNPASYSGSNHEFDWGIPMKQKAIMEVDNSDNDMINAAASIKLSQEKFQNSYLKLPSPALILILKHDDYILVNGLGYILPNQPPPRP